MRRCKTQKAKDGHPGQGGLGTGTQTFPYRLVRCARFVGSLHLELGKIVFLYILYHAVDERDIVGTVLKYALEILKVASLLHHGAVEYLPRMERRKAEKKLHGIEHRVHGAEIVYLTLI